LALFSKSATGAQREVTMKVTRWPNNGEWWGIRISLAKDINGQNDREQYFDHSWASVKIEFDSKIVQPRLTPGFWKNCPELRNKEIGEWVTKNDGILHLLPLDGNRFRLTNR
jgi:hypothetical protein